jgi:6-phosphofructokinase 1
MVFEDHARDAYGHAKLGGIGAQVSERLKELAPAFIEGRKIDTVSQQLGYLVRSGDPDALDSIVPMAYGNLALDLLMDAKHGRLVVLRNGRYGDIPIDVVTSTKKLVDVERHYNTERLRPSYHSFAERPLFIMTSES